MKKLLLLTLINFIAISTFSASVGAKWRWRNNNGTEKTATWKAPERQSIVISDDRELRFRAQFYHEGNIQPTLYYSLPGLDSNGYEFGHVVLIDDNPNTTNAFYIVKNNTYITHREATTSQIPITPSRVFPNPMVYGPGIVITKLDTASFNTSGNLTELEWCIKPTKYLKGSSYYFLTNTRYTAGNQTAAENPILGISVDYAAISPDSITRYSIKKNGHDIHISWQTALQGHHHFEIEGRLDTSRTFKRLATVPGGNARSYQTILKDAPKGMFYYRIKLFDKNQVMSTSRTVKFNNISGDTLLSFTFHPSSTKVLINWKTALNNHDHFILQKSYNNVTFNDIATIPGGIGQNFSTTLPFNEEGTVYVRMKLYDENNRETITKTTKFLLTPHVDLVNFEGSYNNSTGTMQLSFSTSSEYYNKKGFGFQIMKYEYQPDKLVETEILRVKGQAWVQNKITNYTTNDNKVDRRYETRYYLSYFNHGILFQKHIILPVLANATALTFDIYPNPTNSGNVRFDLKGYNGKTIKAMLTNLYGKQISSETFTVNGGEKYVLKTNAAPGTYVLNISGEGLTKSGKVLVQ